MKTTVFKKYSVVIVCLMIIACCFSLFIGLSANAGVNGRPYITGTSTQSADRNYGGRLFVGKQILPLDGLAKYSSTLLNGEVTLRAVPDTHFEFDLSDTGYIFKITLFDDGIPIDDPENPFYIGYKDCDNECDVSCEPDCEEHILAGEYTFTLDSFGLTAFGEIDYAIEVNFIPKVYNINWATKYSHDMDGPDAPFEAEGNFNCTGKETVSWGETISFENTLPGSGGVTVPAKGARFAYAQIQYAVSGLYFNMGITDTPSLTFGKKELDAFVQNGEEIVVVGTYVQMIKVDLISTATQPEDNTLQVIAISPISVQAGGPLKNYSGARTYYFDRGTNLTVYAFDSKSLVFDGFGISNDPGYDPTRDYYINSSVTVPLTITANFGAAEFKVFIRGIQVTLNGAGGYDYGGYLDIGDRGSVVVGNNTIVSSAGGTYISSDKVIKDTAYIPEDGFKFVDIQIKVGRNYYPFTNTVIDDAFIKNYVYNDEIVLVVRLVKQFSLDVLIQASSAGMGDFIVTRDGTAVNLAEEKFFDAGTVLQIEALPASDYHAFMDYVGIAGAAGNTAEIVMNYNRTVKLTFSAASFGLTEESIADTGFTFSRENFRVGETLIITYDNPSNNKINDWTVNGMSYTVFGDDANLEGNVLTLILTPEALKLLSAQISPGGDTFSIAITNKVSTGLSTGVLLAIILPSVAIPVALVILVAVMLVNSKRKKTIKANLTQKMQRDVTFNTGGFISGLKEGSISGGVTDADIKKAMKEEKNKK